MEVIVFSKQQKNIVALKRKSLKENRSISTFISVKFKNETNSENEDILY
jgi:hypothetical protein